MAGRHLSNAAPPRVQGPLVRLKRQWGAFLSFKAEDIIIGAKYSEAQANAGCLLVLMAHRLAVARVRSM